MPPESAAPVPPVACERNVSDSTAHRENDGAVVDCKKIYDTRMMLGFAGDTLTFLGGLILSADALGREREFRKQKDWIETIKEFKGVELTRRGSGYSTKTLWNWFSFVFRSRARSGARSSSHSDSLRS